MWRHLLDAAPGLRARGCDVEVALPAGAAGLRDEASALGLPVRGIMDGADADVFHIHLANTYDRSSLRAMALARWNGAAVVATEHLPRTDASDRYALRGQDRPTPGAHTAKTAFKLAQYGLCRHVVTVSDSSRLFLMDRYGVPARKLVTVHNGVAPPGPPCPWPTSPPRFVAIGSVIVQKGFDLLVEAAARARSHTAWSVDVLGDGPHLAGLATRAEVLGAPVRFCGHRPDVGPVIDAATAVVVPSRWEASSYVSLEAMQHGHAVVAARTDTLPEIVDEGTTGLLVAPDDPNALAAALDRLADDPGLARELGRAGLARVTGFGIDRMVDGLLAVYESSLASPRRSAALEEAA